ELRDSVLRFRAVLAGLGVTSGDRVVAYLPNVPEAVIAALATASLGAIWSTCSPDYAVDAVVHRFSQLAPKVLLVAEGCRYHGKAIALAERNAAISRALPSLQHVILIDGECRHQSSPVTRPAVRWHDAMAAVAVSDTSFERFPFDHPVYVLFTSGTTGTPKPIVHGAGGTLLQTMKEMVLHCDAHAGEPVFWPCTTGWMVWNVMLGSLAWGVPIVLYDGSPAYPDERTVFDIIAAERVAIARIVPPLLSACARASWCPRETHDLSSLCCITSGGSPLLTEHYEYVYRHVKPDVHLMSPAGGTDIMGTLATGNPIGPVYAGEIQCRSLGMDVQVFDESGESLQGEPGDLVCASPFPSVPLGFWGSPRERMVEEYFGVFPGIWRHGDWAEITARGGVIIHGRSDATIKSKGVRIATADIYRPLAAVSEVTDSAAVTLDRAGDSHIVLFVVLRPGTMLDDSLRQRIRRVVREASSAKHVPQCIVQVPDLLRSLNGKPSEIAMRNAINGHASSIVSGLANPELLPVFSALRREFEQGIT